MPTYSKRNVPPCPGSPDDYQLVSFKGAYYWRLRRGRRKPATLNAALQARATAMKVMNPTLIQLRQVFAFFMQPLPAGNLHQRLFGLLQDAWLTKQCFDYRPLRGMDLVPTWPLDRLLKAPLLKKEKDGMIQLTIPATAGAIAPRNRFATEFLLETLLVTGEGQQIATESETSPLYDVAQGLPADCVFEFKLPVHAPWLLLLKAACFEGTEWALNGKHYAVRIVEAGDGSRMCDG